MQQLAGLYAPAQKPAVPRAAPQALDLQTILADATQQALGVPADLAAAKPEMVLAPSRPALAEPVKSAAPTDYRQERLAGMNTYTTAFTRKMQIALLHLLSTTKSNLHWNKWRLFSYILSFCIHVRLE